MISRAYFHDKMLGDVAAQRRDPWYVVGASIIISIFTTLLSIEIGWWAGTWLGALALLPGLVSGAIVLLTQHSEERRDSFLFLIAALAICGISFAIFSRIEDPSSDGPYYHAAAAIRMMQGWNPDRSETGRIWIDSYPHGAWAVRAALAAAFAGNLAAGRLLTMMASLAVFAMTVDFLKTSLPNLEPSRRFASAFLLLANPITIGQITTDYVDGLLGLYALGLLFSLLKLGISRSWLNYTTVVAFAICLIATKTSGVYYVFMMFLGATAWRIWRNLNNKEATSSILIDTISLSIVILLLLPVTCFRPYLTNIIEHRALLYPPLSQLVASQAPANLRNSNSFVKFAYLLFAEGGKGETGEPLVLTPLTINTSCFNFVPWDARAGGFGPFFKYQFILSVILGSACIRHARESSIVLYAGVVCLIATLLFPENWWPRYVPLIWCASIFFVIPLFSTKEPHPIWQKLALGIFLLFAGLNIIVCAYSIARWTTSYNERFNALAAKLEREPGVALQVKEKGSFDLTLGYELKRRGIKVPAEARCSGAPIATMYDGFLRICSTAEKSSADKAN